MSRDAPPNGGLAGDFAEPTLVSPFLERTLNFSG